MSMEMETSPRTHSGDMSIVTKSDNRTVTLKQRHTNPILLRKYLLKMVSPRNVPNVPSIWNREVLEEGSGAARTKTVYTLSP